MISPDLLGRFTTHLKEALQKGLSYCIAHGRTHVEPGDLLMGILLERGCVGAELLSKNNIRRDQADLAFRGVPEIRGPVVAPDLSEAVKKLIEKCVLIAHLHEHRYVGTEHLLAALLEGKYPDIEAFLDATRTDRKQLESHIVQLLKSTSRFPELQTDASEPETEQPSRPEQKTSSNQRAPKGSALEAFTRSLIESATADALDPMIGRDTELQRVIEILCRRTKNNPILLGDPGVGKTAIVEGLASRIASGDVPDILHGKRLLALDLALTVAGTMYRGEFEARLKQIVDEIRTQPDVILFIDEIHTIVGAGSTSGSLDAANILKPALARGEIRCIGATTWNEYKKHIEPDAALERRFQPVPIDEPSPEATQKILDGLVSRYAKHHNVMYGLGVTAACVDFAGRFIPDRFFPDKAIDLLDESAACVVARRQSREQMERLTALEIAIAAAEEIKLEAIQGGELEKAGLASTDAERLQRERISLQEAISKANALDRPRVTVNDVAEVVARISGVPVSVILATERERVKNLHERLGAGIFGQDKAMQSIADVVIRARLGLHDPARPKAALLFYGPSGTGKSETARLLARELFGSDQALIKLDMTEFSESHSVSKLVGSPAGYVGYREQTKLTDAIRKHPHAVVLFDEFEKAHHDVQNLLLQILEDGRLSDGSGRAVSFRHAFIVLTSNAGSESPGRKSLGFEQESTTTIPADLTERFRPELLNRLDRLVAFQTLDHEPMRAIIQRELDTVLKRVSDIQRVACEASEDVIEWLAHRTLPREEGARAARRLVEREITSKLTQLLTEKPLKKKMGIQIRANTIKIV